jgi:Major Facilitator Superfamily
MVLLIGVGAVLVTLTGHPEDVVTTGITTTVVMVLAALSPHDAWQQPILRLADTVRADARAFPLRRGAGGSIPKAPRPDRHAGGPRACIAGPRAASRYRCREAVGGGGPRNIVRRARGGRQSSTAVICRRDGRPPAAAQRGHAQHHDGQRRSGGWPRARRRARRDRGDRRVLLVQQPTPEFRGRVTALWSTAFVGSTPIGAPIVGAIADQAGPRWSLALGAIGCFLAVLIGLALIRRGSTLATAQPDHAHPRGNTRIPNAIPSRTGVLAKSHEQDAPTSK